jgi:hypothetical protein
MLGQVRLDRAVSLRIELAKGECLQLGRCRNAPLLCSHGQPRFQEDSISMKRRRQRPETLQKKGA